MTTNIELTKDSSFRYTVSSAPHQTRTLEKFRFLGLQRDCDARSEVRAYNKRVSICRLGRSGKILKSGSLKSLEMQVEVMQMKFFCERFILWNP